MRLHRCKFIVEDSIWIPAAFLLFFISFRWLSAALLAAAVHELGHIVAVMAFKKEISCIHIGLFGAKIISAPLAPHEAMICIAAGPAASLLLFGLLHIMPRVAFCGLVQGTFNLLPLPGLDGYNLILSFRNMFRKIPCKENEEIVQ